MRIEHVALYVEQLERMREFYRTYFGAVSNDGYTTLEQGCGPISSPFRMGAGWS